MIKGRQVVLRAIQRQDLDLLWSALGGDLEVQSLVSSRPPLPRSRTRLEELAHDARAVGAYRKAGFVEEGRLRRHAWHDGVYRDVLLMGILREEPGAC